MSAAPYSSADEVPAVTLWALSKKFRLDELDELRQLAVDGNRAELQHRVRDKFRQVSSEDELSRLVNELLRMAGTGNAGLDQSESADIIRQLRAAFGVDAKSSPCQPASRHWHVEVAQSSASGGSEGVFIRGRCDAGTVLAVYPGVVYSAFDLPLMTKTVLPGNHYSMFRESDTALRRNANPVARRIKLLC